MLYTMHGPRIFYFLLLPKWSASYSLFVVRIYEQWVRIFGSPSSAAAVTFSAIDVVGTHIVYILYTCVVSKEGGGGGATSPNNGFSFSCSLLLLIYSWSSVLCIRILVYSICVCVNEERSARQVWIVVYIRIPTAAAASIEGCWLHVVSIEREQVASVSRNWQSCF